MGNAWYRDGRHPDSGAEKLTVPEPARVPLDEPKPGLAADATKPMPEGPPEDAADQAGAEGKGPDAADWPQRDAAAASDEGESEESTDNYFTSYEDVGQTEEVLPVVLDNPAAELPKPMDEAEKKAPYSLEEGDDVLDSIIKQKLRQAARMDGETGIEEQMASMEL